MLIRSPFRPVAASPIAASPIAARRLLITAVLLAGLVGAAASSSASEPYRGTSVGSDASGVWRGSWHSSPTGHRGPLNAKIRQVSPDRYEALFYGRFFVVIPFAYRATLDRVPGTADLYHSSKRMPIVGNYQTTARISGGNFQANFQSGKDSGVFQMSRRR
jgi:hypothetical protein